MTGNHSSTSKSDDTLLSHDQLPDHDLFAAAVKKGQFINLIGDLSSGKTDLIKNFLDKLRQNSDEVLLISCIDLNVQYQAVHHLIKRVLDEVEREKTTLVLWLDNWDYEKLNPGDFPDLQSDFSRLKKLGTGYCVVISSGIPVLNWQSKRGNSPFENIAPDEIVEHYLTTQLIGINPKAHNSENPILNPRWFAIPAMAAGGMGGFAAGALGLALAGPAVVLPLLPIIGAGAIVANKMITRNMNKKSMERLLDFKSPGSAMTLFEDDRCREEMADVCAGWILHAESRSQIDVAGLVHSGILFSNPKLKNTYTLAPWLLYLIRNAQKELMETDKIEGVVSLSSLISKAIVNKYWEAFLLELRKANSWVSSELKEYGIDLDKADSGFILLLYRQQKSPAEFLSYMLRLSDLKQVFPQADFSRSKLEVIDTQMRKWISREK